MIWIWINEHKFTPHSPFLIYATAPACITPDSKVHGINMGPIWGRQYPGGTHLGPMNVAVWGTFHYVLKSQANNAGNRQRKWCLDEWFRVHMKIKLINKTTVLIIQGTVHVMVVLLLDYRKFECQPLLSEGFSRTQENNIWTIRDKYWTEITYQYSILVSKTLAIIGYWKDIY